MEKIYKKDGVELLSPCCNEKLYEIHYYYTSINCSKCKEEYTESEIEKYNKKNEGVDKKSK